VCVRVRECSSNATKIRFGQVRKTKRVLDRVEYFRSRVTCGRPQHALSRCVYRCVRKRCLKLLRSLSRATPLRLSFTDDVIYLVARSRARNGLVAAERERKSVLRINSFPLLPNASARFGRAAAGLRKREPAMRDACRHCKYVCSVIR